MSIFDDVGARQARKPTHKCPGCSRIGIGKRSTLCINCEEQAAEARRSTHKLCEDCGDPIIGKSIAKRIRCKRCQKDHQREVGRDLSREKWRTISPEGRKKAGMYTKKFKSTPAGIILVERDWRKQNDKRLKERRAAGLRTDSDEGRKAKSIAAQRRWTRVRAERAATAVSSASPSAHKS